MYIYIYVYMSMSISIITINNELNIYRSPSTRCRQVAHRRATVAR